MTNHHKPGTREYVERLAEDFCQIVSLVRTATGDAGVAMDLSQAITPAFWVLGGCGAMDWAHHTVLDTTETPREILAKVRKMLRDYFAQFPVIPQEGMMVPNGSRAMAEDLDFYRAEAKKLLAMTARKISTNERDGIDPKANRGFNIF
jgi:hypothetical protein